METSSNGYVHFDEIAISRAMSSNGDILKWRLICCFVRLFHSNYTSSCAHLGTRLVVHLDKTVISRAMSFPFATRVKRSFTVTYGHNSTPYNSSHVRRIQEKIARDSWKQLQADTMFELRLAPDATIEPVYPDAIMLDGSITGELNN